MSFDDFLFCCLCGVIICVIMFVAWVIGEIGGKQ
jgi:hypothetical protein